MRRGLARDARATLRSFWRACEAGDFASPEALDVAQLDQGLDWLMRWDARAKKAQLNCLTLALAARDDAIVPAPMTEAIWNHTSGAGPVIWSDHGGHALPLRRPEWCARHILDFAHALGS
jgi:pimeloyl-[acyl-carrier protein] methyl ester esterase